MADRRSSAEAVAVPIRATTTACQVGQLGRLQQRGPGHAARMNVAATVSPAPVGSTAVTPGVAGRWVAAVSWPPGSSPPARG